MEIGTNSFKFIPLFFWRGGSWRLITQELRWLQLKYAWRYPFKLIRSFALITVFPFAYRLTYIYHSWKKKSLTTWHEFHLLPTHYSSRFRGLEKGYLCTLTQVGLFGFFGWIFQVPERREQIPLSWICELVSLAFRKILAELISLTSIQFSCLGKEKDLICPCCYRRRWQNTEENATFSSEFSPNFLGDLAGQAFWIDMHGSELCGGPGLWKNSLERSFQRQNTTDFFIMSITKRKKLKKATYSFNLPYY